MEYNYIKYCEGIRNIVQQIGNSKYDYVVGVERGGLIPAIHLSHILKIPLIRVKCQTRDGASFGFAEVYCDADYDHHSDLEKDCDLWRVLNKRVLMVDDIIDTGKTCRIIEETLRTVFNWCSLIYNTNQPYTPRYYGHIIDRNVDKEFVNFWWEKSP